MATKTEAARARADSAYRSFHKAFITGMRKHERTGNIPSEMHVSTGLGEVARALSSMSAALKDIYDKLQQMDRKLH